MIEAGGDATIWIGELASRGQERALAARMAETISQEYATVIAAAYAATTAEPQVRGGVPSPVCGASYSGSVVATTSRRTEREQAEAAVDGAVGHARRRSRPA